MGRIVEWETESSAREDVCTALRAEGECGARGISGSTGQNLVARDTG